MYYQQLHLLNTTNGTIENHEPIPYSKPNSNTDSKPNKTVNDLRFEEFWKLYPKKVEKKNARKIYKKIYDDNHKIIIKDLSKRVHGKKWT